MPRYSPVYIGLLCVLGRQFGVLVVSPPAYGLSIKCSGWISCYCDCRCRNMLALQSSSGASRPIDSATIVYYDNVSAVYLSANPVQHRRTKHIELDIHVVREKVTIGALRVLHVPSSSQFADIFTKGLSSALFTEFRASLHVGEPPSSDCGGVLWRYPTPCLTTIS
jgi:hypothetical protein